MHQLLEVMLCVCSDGCIVCKEDVSYGGFADLGLSSESCHVAQLDPICMYTPSVEVPKTCLRMREKMPKSVGARTQTCFTALLMLKGSDMLP